MSDTNPFSGLRDYQVPHAKQLLRALLNHGAALDASDTGTGKTFVALTVAKILGISPLIIGPKAAKYEWKRAGELLGVPLDFINYERARMASTGLGIEKKHGSGSYWEWTKRFAMLIFDEAHKCGGSTSLNGKMLRSSTKASQFVIALSATLADSPLQMKNIGTALKLFETKNYFDWLMRHGVKPGVFGGFELRDAEVTQNAMSRIHAQIFPHRGARMRRALIPNFPQTLIDVRLIEADEEAKTLVEEIGKLAGNDIGGYIERRQKLDNKLLNAVRDLAEESISEGRKVCIFPKFVVCIDVLRHYFLKAGYTVGVIDGRQVGEKGDLERREVKEAFQRNELDVVLVNQDAGGAGISLHDPTGRVERDSYIFPADSGRTLKQIFGRVQRDGGAFSRQFLLGFAGTLQENILLQSLEKLRRIDSLNDGELDALRF